MSEPDANLETIESDDDLDDALERERLLVYKHSPACFQSFLALGQVRRFALEHPDTPVFMVDVMEQRALSLEIARRLGVRHASPQTLLVEHGEVVWHASHMGIRFRKLESAVT